jgi:hypothetical protein
VTAYDRWKTQTPEEYYGLSEDDEEIDDTEEPEDGESPTEVTNTLKMYADWHLNGERYGKQSEEHYAKGNRKWTEAYEGWLHRVTEAVNKIEKPKSE